MDNTDLNEMDTKCTMDVSESLEIQIEEKNQSNKFEEKQSLAKTDSCTMVEVVLEPEASTNKAETATLMGTTVTSTDDNSDQQTELQQQADSSDTKQQQLKPDEDDQNDTKKTAITVVELDVINAEESTVTDADVGYEICRTGMSNKKSVFKEYRHASSGDESSTSVSSDDESGPESIGGRGGGGSSSDDSDTEKNKPGKEKAKKVKVIKTKGEITLQDLPPIEDLQITVDDSVHLFDVGSITAVVGVLVIVQGKADMPALNIDSVLFIEGRTSLGQVFETFGPVASPLYTIRFNSPEEIEEKKIEKGMAVYYAPEKEEYTKYVFVNQLTTLKGSDASWEHNNEPPAKFLDYSDDEAERRAKQKKKHRLDENEREDGNKENNEKRARNRKKWEKRQNREGQGEPSGQGQQQGQGQPHGQEQRRGQQDTKRREPGFQSWPPSRREMSGDMNPSFRPPPPPQMVPDGYAAQRPGGPMGFQMRQPRPFRPQPSPDRFMNSPPPPQDGFRNSSAPPQQMSGPGPINGGMHPPPHNYNGPAGFGNQGNYPTPPLNNGRNEQYGPSPPPPYSNNYHYGPPNNGPPMNGPQGNGDEYQNRPPPYSDGPSPQNFCPPPSGYYPHNTNLAPRMREPPPPPQQQQYNYTSSLPYPPINSPPPPYPPMNNNGPPPRGQGPSFHHFGGPPRFYSGPRSQSNHQQNTRIMDSRLVNNN